MSTIDMTQVAGLQAVDAEGNVIGTLSVDDLTNLVANNLVKSTQNQVVAARSVSTMSEASTLAASDDYENTLPIDANPASVRTLDAAGNPKQTGISALAQVVGGLIGSATTEKAGLFSAADKLKLLTLSITAGSGGTNNWYKICEFAASTYTPIFVKGGAKLYNGSSFIPIGAIANLHDGNLYVANENSNTIAKIGVLKKDGRADLYLKMQGFYGASMLIISPAITQAYCNERGELIVETTEPSGIVYE